MKMTTGGFEYHKDEDKTQKNRIGDFFTVGDLGYLDEDGYLFLRDRKIDMIISGGVNIYPAEIESALLAHPAVADAAAFGIPHDDWGEEVKAVVEPAPGREPGPDLAADILDHCAEQLAGYKRPKSDRLHRRDAPRPQRQAVQAAAARAVLGGADTASVRGGTVWGGPRAGDPMVGEAHVVDGPCAYGSCGCRGRPGHMGDAVPSHVARDHPDQPA